MRDWAASWAVLVAGGRVMVQRGFVLQGGRSVCWLAMLPRSSVLWSSQVPGHCIASRPKSSAVRGVCVCACSGDGADLTD